MNVAVDQILCMKDIEKKFDVMILGLGKTGISCARFFSSGDKNIALADSRLEPPGLETARTLFPDIPIYLGAFDAEVLCSARELIVSPGLSPAEPAIDSARRAGIGIIGDIEVFCQQATRPIIAVTGSNGKSTVASLVYSMIERSGKQARLGGNIGVPALDLLNEAEPDFYVLELSSFQLETTRSLNAAAAVVLNVTEDHMDRYADLDEYAEAKLRIYRGTGAMVVNLDDDIVASVDRSNRNVICYTAGEPGISELGIREIDGRRYIAMGEKTVCAADELPLHGNHNLSNMLAALALGTAIGLPVDSMLAALRDFHGLPHRCQWVTRIKEVDWFNDSKATNVGACCAAIEGLAGSDNLILIAGGEGKGADFSRLAEVSPGRVKQAILIGRDANRLAAVLQDVCNVCFAVDLDTAVRLAFDTSVPGDVVLLSPACASLDMFTDYQHRGNEFVGAIARICRE